MKKYKYIILGVLFVLGLGAFIAWLNLGQIKGYARKALLAYRFKQESPHRLPDVYFSRETLGEETRQKFTSLVIGPDGYLYGLTLKGKILKYQIKEDGTLGLRETYRPFGETEKIAIGLTFSPNAHQKHLEAWVTYCDHPHLREGPPWDGRLARLRLSDEGSEVLENTLVITNLPRSARDHLTNGIAFDDNGWLYFGQGSNTGMGRATDDKIWMYREEALLAGTILKLKWQELPDSLPIDVKTRDGGGTYDPFAPEAPLIIHSTGIRNNYDLVWHSSGHLYAGVNGCRFGKNTPTSNPQDSNYIAPDPHFTYNGPTDIPALNKVGPAQSDFFHILEEGKYYGNPNPLRAEYALNRGAKDVDHPAYDHVKPDPNYRFPLHEYGKHASPSGTIEYMSDAFGGALKNTIMILRFNLYFDVSIIRLSEDGMKVEKVFDGEPLGLGPFNQPLDLVEDKRNGNLYVSEFGGKGRIILLKPAKKGEVTPPPAQDKNLASNDNRLNENNVRLTLQENHLKEGGVVYEENCALCHGEDGNGSSGPSLRDQEWLHGNSIQAVFKIVKYGSLEAGMPAWGERLSAEEIRDVSSYILSWSDSVKTESATALNEHKE